MTKGSLSDLRTFHPRPSLLLGTEGTLRSNALSGTLEQLLGGLGTRALSS